MNIKVLGKTKMDRGEVKYAAAFFAHYMLGVRLASSLSVTVLFREEERGINGMCLPIDFFEKRCKSFIVTIKPGMSRAKTLQTLAHEMVHVKQYAKGELNMGLASVKFKGKSYGSIRTFEDYYNSPWEIEAYGREYGLVLFYRSACKQENVSFKRGRLYINGKLFKVPKKKA